MTPIDDYLYSTFHPNFFLTEVVMFWLAILHNERVYEGNPQFLNAVHPMPCVSRVVPTENTYPDFLGPVNPHTPPIFREDSFDPTMRIRRGRFYLVASPSQLQLPRARVNHFPYADPIAGNPSSYPFELYCSLQPGPIRVSERPTVSLGDQNYCSGWRAVEAERLFNGETLFTLKAGNTLGALPNLNEDALPAESRTDILSAFEKVADAAHRYLPEAIVDLCREFACLVLRGWLPPECHRPGDDLAKLIRRIPNEYVGIENAAAIINRLHPRGKSSEKDRQAAKGKEVRSISSEDGELSVSLTAFLLREVGWA